MTGALRRNCGCFTESCAFPVEATVFLPKNASLPGALRFRDCLACDGAMGETGAPGGHSRRLGFSFQTSRTATMAGTVEQKLAEQGIVLHQAPAPVANYVPFVRTGNLIFVSGQVCYDPQGKLIAKGKLGAGLSIEQGAAAARGCAVNLLAQLKAALGDLDKVTRVVRLGGFINSAPDFVDGPKVLNGASDLMVAAFGDKGRHARTTVGVASLPGDAAVEVEGIFEVA
jgi:enamine deaminase RidA (YjgF/YER057c/UK114 family)